MLATLIALAVANGPLAEIYHHALHFSTGITLSEKLGPMTIHMWINECLMTIFFLLVGLEIKRELFDGRLSSWEQRRLPALPALMGVCVPAALYLLVVGNDGDTAVSNGWAVPAATDIAFAVGVLALLGKHVPLSLKLLLVSIAILDDIAAVVIIALFYTAYIDMAALVAAFAILTLMLVLNKLRVMKLWPYMVCLALLWYAVLLSGIHATIAGVAGALLIPFVATPGQPDAGHSPLHRLEHAIAPWAGLFIVPAFGFANAGISFAGINLSSFLAPLPFGIAVGLLLGKQIGVFSGIVLAVKSGLASKPRGATWVQIYAVSILCGIGFTMSLFISGLAFPDNPELVEEAKLGIMLGSLLSAIIACLILRFAPNAEDQAQEAKAQKAEIRLDGDVARI